MIASEEDEMRKYFPELFGNEQHKARISSAIIEGKLPHAFLIDGPSGSGKMTLAKSIAAALNCEKADDDSYHLPCGKCNSCRRIRENSFTDVKILERPTDKATIGANLVKDFRADMYLTATESKYKIYIITEAEKMTVEAQNALLIILEEPPKNVIIMLLASGTDAILTTIKSRAQYIAMSKFTSEELGSYLESTSYEATRMAMDDPKGYKSLVVSADGRIGRALELLDPKRRSDNEQKRRESTAILEAVAKRAPYTALYEAVTALPSKRNELTESLEMLISALRDMITAKKSEGFTPVFFGDKDEARELGTGISLSKLIAIYEAVADAHDQCLKNANVSLIIAKLAADIKMS